MRLFVFCSILLLFFSCKEKEILTVSRIELQMIPQSIHFPIAAPLNLDGIRIMVIRDQNYLEDFSRMIVKLNRINYYYENSVYIYCKIYYTNGKVSLLLQNGLFFLLDGKVYENSQELINHLEMQYFSC